MTNWFKDFGIILWSSPSKINSQFNQPVQFHIMRYEQDCRDAAIMQHLSNIRNTPPKNKLVALEFIKSNTPHW